MLYCCQIHVGGQVKMKSMHDEVSAEKSLEQALRCHGEGDPEAAIRHGKAALQAEPDNIEAMLLLGRSFSVLGDLPSAGHYFNLAIESGAISTEPYLGLGEINMQMGRVREALSCYRHARRIAPEDPAILNACALALWSAGKAGEAIGELQQAIELDPENAFSYRNLRVLSSRQVDRWHFPMVNDTVRNARFDAAIRRVVSPDSTVLDIGAGTGLLSLMAARAGARHVIACEANPALASLAREVVRRNGYSDRIRVINGASRQLVAARDFPGGRRADVLVAEVFDTMVIGEGALDTFGHARRELLVPDARLIPGRAVLYAAPIESERLWQEGGASQADGFDLSALNRFRPDMVVLEAASFRGRMLGDAVEVFDFDLRAADTTPARRRLEIPIRRAGVFHGLVFWIHLDLGDGVSLDNRPAFDDETMADGYCRHWYQAVKLLVPAPGVEPGARLRVDACHNGRNLAVLVYDPATGKPLG